jgi:hypothetical protein
MGNMLAWGDQPIPEPLDEVSYIEAITYDKKRKLLVRRTQRKIKLTLDNTMVMTTEETLLDEKKAKVSELLGAGMAISHATIDRAKEYEREVVSMRKELESLRHQVDYYKDTTHAMMILREDFLEEHGIYKLVIDVFMEKYHNLSRGNHVVLCST